MNIYVCSPPRCVTGGVELLQQLVCELNRQYFGIAKILYIDDMPEAGYPVPWSYEKYRNPFMVNVYGEEGAVFILPEIWAALAETHFKGCSCVIWWESVDNYFRTTPSEKWYSFVNDKTMMHMVQSMYARGFLMANAGIAKERILEVSDYLGEDFLAGEMELDASRRRRNVLYNPAKGFDFTCKLMEAAPELTWVPITRMPPGEVAALMRESRVYVDFGDHPGKDRMPREAAACGCCIITGRNGSASYYEDVPIMGNYKFERKEANIPAICQRIKQLMDGYDQYIGDFSFYRNVIHMEREKFQESVGMLVSVLMERFGEGKREGVCITGEGNVIGIAVYGMGGYSGAAREMIEGEYNSLLKALDENNCGFLVKCFVGQKPGQSPSKEIPVLLFEEFVNLYRKQAVAGIVIPVPAYRESPFAVTDLIRAGVDVNDIYCIEKNHFVQEGIKTTADLLTPYLECPYLL